MANKVLVIDPGHGGTDPGAVANGLLEKVLTLDISQRVKSYLEAHFEGVTIYLTRTTDTTLSLKQRTDFANAKGADFLQSIHINAGGGTGYEDFIYPGTGGVTAQAQDYIHASVMAEISSFNVRDRGQKEANFHMLRESNMPACLSENLFIDTLADANLLKRADFLEAVSRGHAKGLAKVLGLKAKTAPAPAPKPAPAPGTEDTHRILVDGKQIGAFGDDTNVLSAVAKHMKKAKKITIEKV